MLSLMKNLFHAALPPKSQPHCEKQPHLTAPPDVTGKDLGDNIIDDIVGSYHRDKDDDAEPHAPPPPPPTPPHITPGPCRSQRKRHAPKHPGNIYGENRHPIDQFRDVENPCTWKKMVEGSGSLQCQDPPGHVPDPTPPHLHPKTRVN
ncbi:hypothetical protein PAXINDRAFT_16394 [Paxillus involutus ATCC 200175]|uniref:Uncharacterized protein n=1 Tax=Paxillus involutus ATCC 200175 TaxID=664439 RepID=A0A0C9TIT7_PAXIN|nr:hypothetical protein PAXINDRAFT_16394 [Paxillus involutus ATCC 200175]